MLLATQITINADHIQQSATVAVKLSDGSAASFALPRISLGSVIDGLITIEGQLELQNFWNRSPIGEAHSTLNS
jgi:hypothetical protein